MKQQRTTSIPTFQERILLQSIRNINEQVLFQGKVYSTHMFLYGNSEWNFILN